MKWIWPAVKLFLAVLFFFLAVRAFSEAGRRMGCAVVFLENGAVSAGEAAAIGEQEAEAAEPSPFCFYSERRDMELACTATGQSAYVTETAVYGNAELLFPEAAILNWNAAGCLLDERTAEALFGTAEAAGQSVVCGEKSYTVCGTVLSAQAVFVRRAAAEDGGALNRIALQSKGSAEAASQFLLRHSLSGYIVDFQTVSALVWDLCLLCPLLLGISIIRSLLSGPRRPPSQAQEESDDAQPYTARRRNWSLSHAKDETGGSHFQNRFHLQTAAGIVLFAALAAVVWHFLVIPENMIPSRWSDFSFWGKWLETEKRSLLLLLNSPLGDAQLSAVLALLRAAACSVLAAFFVS